MSAGVVFEVETVKAVESVKVLKGVGESGWERRGGKCDVSVITRSIEILTKSENTETHRVHVQRVHRQIVCSQV